MIGVMLEADGVSWNAFAQLLESAARVLAMRRVKSPPTPKPQVQMSICASRCDKAHLCSASISLRGGPERSEVPKLPCDRLAGLVAELANAAREPVPEA